MDLASLIAALAAPSAYPHPVGVVEIRHTHISVVFLAGALVYKVKKPVNLGFVDFSTLEKRRHFCEEEIRLNRRLAPQVYLGVVPLVRTQTGIKVAGQGELLDWAVKMERLPDEATLQARIRRGEVGAELVQTLARRIAAFHQGTETNERIAAFGRFQSVARIILDIFAQAEPQVGTTVSRTVFDRVKALAEKALGRLRSLIVARAARGMPRDCHGDLHLDHVYYFPEKKPPADLAIIDCIEFNERFRFIDPVADMAFPAMDFSFHGRRDLARIFADAYFRATGDEEGRALLPLYTAYRATVRGMVEGLELTEKEVPQSERTAALERARAYWLLALTELEEPARKPCLVLVMGLPGSGKSWLARQLAENADFTVVRSDVVRKELAGLAPEEPPPPEWQESLYTHAWNERTYAECLARAGQLLFQGQRVLVDATFREDHNRELFLKSAAKWGVPSGILLCQAEPETVHKRLENRHGDASDANWAVYRQLAAKWEALGPWAAEVAHTVSTEGSPQQTLSGALDALRQLSFR